MNLIKISKEEYEAAKAAMRAAGSIECHTYRDGGLGWNNFYSMKCSAKVWSSSDAGVNKEYWKLA